jgi:uncharacterized protein (UPF0332 family)
VPLFKAREFLQVAELCLEGGYYNSTASRAYYAMFHAAASALEMAGLGRETWSHSCPKARSLLSSAGDIRCIVSYSQDIFMTRIDFVYKRTMARQVSQSVRPSDPCGGRKSSLQMWRR